MTNPNTPPPQYPFPPGLPPVLTPAQPARFTIHYGFALLAIFSLIGTLIPTIIMFAAAGGSDDGTEAGRTAAGIGGGFAILYLLAAACGP